MDLDDFGLQDLDSVQPGEEGYVSFLYQCIVNAEDVLEFEAEKALEESLECFEEDDLELALRTEKLCDYCDSAFAKLQSAIYVDEVHTGEDVFFSSKIYVYDGDDKLYSSHLDLRRSKASILNLEEGLTYENLMKRLCLEETEDLCRQERKKILVARPKIKNITPFEIFQVVSKWVQEDFDYEHPEIADKRVVLEAELYGDIDFQEQVNIVILPESQDYGTDSNNFYLN